MVYAKAPINFKRYKGISLLYSQKGLFIVADEEMADLLCFLERVNFISESSIIDAWKRISKNEIDPKEVLDYLTDETQVLLKLNDNFKIRRSYFISGSDIDKNILNEMYFDDIMSYEDYFESQYSNRKVKAILIFDMLKNASSEKINHILDSLSPDSIAIFIFKLGDSFIISNAFCRSNALPCTLCLYDYVMDRVFTDRSNKVSSISNVIDYMHEHYNMTVPDLPINNLDIAYLLRELEQYILTLSGGGRGFFTNCDVNYARIININSLEKDDLKIPFSPQCDCLKKYHNNLGYKNA